MMDLEQLPVFAERDRLEAALRAERAARERAEAKLTEWQKGQHYNYIGRDGKPVLARNLEDRAERAEAMVAAAYRDAADQVAMTMRHTILARTPADASAMLDRIRQEAADEALERAAEAADYIQNKYWRPVRVFRTETETAIDDGKRDCAEEIAAAIRALKGGAK